MSYREVPLTKKKLRYPDYVLIAANLLPIAGIFIWNWSPFEIFLVYAVETIIVGVFTLLKMAVITFHRGGDTWYSKQGGERKPGIFFMLFFLVHYGMFVGIQMALFCAVSGMGGNADITPFNFFYKWPSLLQGNVTYLLLGFVVSYGARFFSDFIYRKEYKSVSMMRIMFQPYIRIVIQQFTVILGSIFLSFGAGTVFIVIFALIKTWFEVFINFENLVDRGLQGAKERSGEQ